MTRYQIIDAPTNGTVGQDCGTFDINSLPVRIQAAIKANPHEKEWTLPALSDGETGTPLEDLEIVVRAIADDE